MSAFSAAAQDEDGDIISALRARVADLEAQLYAVGAGGVGKLEQPQSVTDCHQSQPQGEQEPVAWIENIGGGVSYNPYHEAARKLPDGVRFDLYTHPQPKREPLTDEQQIAEAMRRHGLVLVKTVNGYDVLKLGQITAHGITGEAK